MHFIIKPILVVWLLLTVSLAGACERSEECLDSNQWQFGIAMGLGVTSNPLEGGDSIPLIVLPDIAWYGEAAYFDNGELGYQWLDQPSTSFVTYLSVDKERAFFSFWHPANILLPLNRVSESAVADNPGQSGPQLLSISIDEVSRRDWAIMGGGRWYFRQSNAEWQVALEKDISGTHNGEKLDLSYQHYWQWPTIRLSTQIKMIWKSSALVNYYYGVSERDKVAPSFYYRAGSGWQPVVSLSMQKQLQNNWSWLNRISLQKLHSGMTDSPLVAERNIYSVFSGLAYQF